MTKEQIKYYIKQADIAHDLYKEKSGKVESVWLGVAKGFQRQVANESLFEICIKEANEIMKLQAV
jgi:hypothetical protein